MVVHTYNPSCSRGTDGKIVVVVLVKKKKSQGGEKYSRIKFSDVSQTPDLQIDHSMFRSLRPAMVTLFCSDTDSATVSCYLHS
jgi:hypothetical protein